MRYADKSADKILKIKEKRREKPFYNVGIW